MRFFKLFSFILLVSCSGVNESSVSTDSALTSEQEVEIAPELVISAEVDSSDENPYDYKNHSKYYICNDDCKDNTKVQNNGKIRGEFILQIENEIISDLDFLSENEILLTAHNAGKILLYNIVNESYNVWFDMTSLVLVNGTQETGIHNIEYSSKNTELFVSYTSKQNRFIVSKFNVNNMKPDITSELKLIDENHLSSSHYCGALVLDDDINRLFGCLGDSQLDQLSLVNWNLHGSIFSINTLDGSPHKLNPTANSEKEFSTDAVMNRGSFEADKRIIATGFRNPWNFSISNNGNFLVVPDVGWSDYEELNTINLQDSDSKFYGWPLVEGPYFRKHYARQLLKSPITNFFTTEKDIATDIAFNNSVPPVIYYYHDDNSASIIGGQFFKTSNSWNEYYIFTDMFTGYFTLVKFDEQGNVTSHFHLTKEFDNEAPIISLENDFNGNILGILADGSVYKLKIDLD
jgi:hypothetical protein